MRFWIVSLPLRTRRVPWGGVICVFSLQISTSQWNAHFSFWRRRRRRRRRSCKGHKQLGAFDVFARRKPHLFGSLFHLALLKLVKQTKVNQTEIIPLEMACPF